MSKAREEQPSGPFHCSRAGPSLANQVIERSRSRAGFLRAALLSFPCAGLPDLKTAMRTAPGLLPTSSLVDGAHPNKVYDFTVNRKRRLPQQRGLA
jgi:hypothetical protein